MKRKHLTEQLPRYVELLVESTTATPTINHLNRVYMPSRDVIIGCIHRLQQLIFPGYFGKQGLTNANLLYRTGELVTELGDLLYDQVRWCLRYRQELPGGNGGTEQCEECDRKAAEAVATFFERIPAVREVLAADVQAAFDGDPAAQSTDEIIFSYPGVFAILVQRLAHEFFKLGVPLLPRIMTEYAHSVTGIDIHPGATLGRSFFIDHGTGVVIGETSQIGNNVKVYQGVTLGALAPAFGQVLRGHKRHPTIEDDVTIYSGATILGGDTIIGRGAVINGNVFIIASVPAHTIVGMEPPKLTYRQRRKAREASDEKKTP